jgi:hypothetical protein
VAPPDCSAISATAAMSSAWASAAAPPSAAPTNRAGVSASVRLPCLRVWSTVFDPLISRPGAVRSTAKIAVPEPVRAYT